MKTIGLIGGVTWHSTLEYYQQINQKVTDKLGGHHSAQLVITSVDFAEIFAAQSAGQEERVVAILKEHLRKLEHAGVDAFAVCANTLHMHSNALTEATSLPMIHIVDETGRRACELKLRKLYLLGTGFTMKHPFFVSRLKEKFGVDILVPDEQSQANIHDSIFNELVKGEILPNTKAMYLDQVKLAQSKGCDGVILVCTEIPLILSSKDTDFPLLDTTAIHADSICNFIFS